MTDLEKAKYYFAVLDIWYEEDRHDLGISLDVREKAIQVSFEFDFDGRFKELEV